MWPTPIDQDYRSAIDKVLRVLHRNGVPGWFGYNKLEFTANVGMFVPLGFLLALVLPARRWWLSLVIAPLFSVAIEATQGFFLSARFSSAWDVVANSIGALIGIILALIVRALVHARDQKVVERALWEARERSGYTNRPPMA
jgi:glycopeptide antibiotics resistance protein